MRRIVIIITIAFLGIFFMGCELTSPQEASEWHIFSTAALHNINALDFSDPARGMAVCDQGTVQFWDGQIWTSQTLKTLVNLHGLKLLGNEAWAVGDGGSIFHMTTEGFWSAVHSPTDSDLYAVTADGLGKGWAVGRDGVILELNQGVWQLADSPTSSSLRALAADSQGRIWAVGDGVALYYIGDSWQIDSSFPSWCFATSISIISTDMMVVGFGGAMLKNDGNGWYEIDSGTLETLWSISRDNSGDGWAVGERDRAVRIGADGSIRSSRLSYPAFSRTLYSVFTLSVDEAWSGTEDGLVYHYY